MHIYTLAQCHFRRSFRKGYNEYTHLLDLTLHSENIYAQHYIITNLIFNSNHDDEKYNIASKYLTPFTSLNMLYKYTENIVPTAQAQEFACTIGKMVTTLIPAWSECTSSNFLPSMGRKFVTALKTCAAKCH
jgi:hypothetical protein